MREVIQNHSPRSYGWKSWPEQVIITEVPGYQFSCSDRVFKATIYYQSKDRGRVTTTRRFATIKQARYWARNTIRGDRARDKPCVR